MKKTTLATLLAALTLSVFAGAFASGCKSDPHDTHIHGVVPAAR